MARTRAKSPPRLTRDAERLIALALGLNASGSLTEDRYWEAEMSALVARLLANGNDAPLDGALDHLYQTNLGAYDTLIELVENESESLGLEQGETPWQAPLVAAPIVAWSKYAIPSGPIHKAEADTLKVQLGAHVLAADARVAVVPYLYSIDQLPRQFSELRQLTSRLAASAIAGEAPKLDASRLPETAHLLADTRFVVACAAVMVLRKTRPDVKRPFTAPGGAWTPILGVLSCTYLMVSLAVLTWLRFLIWLDIGMLIYWFYSRSHSPLFNADLEAKKSSREKTNDAFTMWGGLGLFNGFWITLVGMMSVLGINGEATARWHEVGVTPIQASILGFLVLAVSSVLFLIGRPRKTA